MSVLVLLVLLLISILVFVEKSDLTEEGKKDLLSFLKKKGHPQKSNY